MSRLIEALAMIGLVLLLLVLLAVGVLLGFGVAFGLRSLAVDRDIANALGFAVGGLGAFFVPIYFFVHWPGFIEPETPSSQTPTRTTLTRGQIVGMSIVGSALWFGFRIVLMNGLHAKLIGFSAAVILAAVIGYDVGGRIERRRQGGRGY